MGDPSLGPIRIAPHQNFMNFVRFVASSPSSGDNLAQPCLSVVVRRTHSSLRSTDVLRAVLLSQATSMSGVPPEWVEWAALPDDYFAAPPLPDPAAEPPAAAASAAQPPRPPILDPGDIAQLATELRNIFFWRNRMRASGGRDCPVPPCAP